MPIILSVGRVVEAKNYATALRAVARIRMLDWEYWIAGSYDPSDAVMQQLASLVEDLGLQKRVHFLGYRSDVPQLLASSDIFLLPSAWEGFGLAAVEAMAAGLPVVVSDVVGVREVLGAGGVGVTVDPYDPLCIARQLEALLTDSERRRAMGARGIERAKQFSIHTTVERYLRVYAEVTPGRGRPGPRCKN